MNPQLAPKAAIRDPRPGYGALPQTRAQLLTALASGHFEAHAQPIVRLDTREVARYELLLRMRRDDGGLLLPAAFLNLLRQRDLMPVIDRWMARTAVQLAAKVSEGSDLRLHVNVCPESLTDIALYDGIVNELELSGADPGRLVFELTETSDVDCTSGVPLRMIESLARLGSSIALDDFGAGFNTLVDLKYLPIACVKIDGRFVKDLRKSRFDRRIVCAVTMLAQRLDMETVAEYVTDDAAADYLTEIGVDFGQGALFGMAQPLDRIPSLSPSNLRTGLGGESTLATHP